jgi:hypothetical protein
MMRMEIKRQFLFIFVFLLLPSPPILHGAGGCYGFTLYQEQIVRNRKGGKCLPPPIYDPLVTPDSLHPWFSLTKQERLRIRSFNLASDRPSPHKPTQYSTWSNVCLHLVNSKYGEVPPICFVSATQERVERKLQRIVWICKICRNESRSLIPQPPVPFLKHPAFTNAFKISLLGFPAFILSRYMFINSIQKYR